MRQIKKIAPRIWTAQPSIPICLWTIQMLDLIWNHTNSRQLTLMKTLMMDLMLIDSILLITMISAAASLATETAAVSATLSPFAVPTHDENAEPTQGRGQETWPSVIWRWNRAHRYRILKRVMVEMSSKMGLRTMNRQSQWLCAACLRANRFLHIRLQLNETPKYSWIRKYWIKIHHPTDAQSESQGTHNAWKSVCVTSKPVVFVERGHQHIAAVRPVNKTIHLGWVLGYCKQKRQDSINFIHLWRGKNICKIIWTVNGTLPWMIMWNLSASSPWRQITEPGVCSSNANRLPSMAAWKNNKSQPNIPNKNRVKNESKIFRGKQQHSENHYPMRNNSVAMRTIQNKRVDEPT